MSELDGVDRSFVIVQISDLHLDGVGTYKTAIDALISTVRQKLSKINNIPVRILLITGDLVNDPTSKAIAEAQSVVAKFRESNLFTDIRAIAGNHDVKKYGLVKNYRLLGGYGDAYEELQLPRHAESKYYAEAGLDLILLDSNGASFAKGKIGKVSYDSMVSNSANLAADLRQGVRHGESTAGDHELDVRILALHHHPLPQATGEGKRVLGIPDEPLMYLVSPATFLEAAISLDVSLILHGHRHVQGLTRYSVPNPLATNSKSEENFWRTIYVLSCPSSTGHGGDDAGFNVIHFSPSFAHRRRQQFFAITRFVRRRNAGAFEFVDDGLPDGAIKLAAGRDYYRDPAFQVSIEMQNKGRLKRKDVLLFARQLLVRRAFYDETKPSWAHALYTYLVTYHVWEDLLSRFSGGLKRDIEPMQEIRLLLAQLVSHCADVLGISGSELDDLRSQRLINNAQIMDNLPRNPRPGVNEDDSKRQRMDLIRKINQQSEQLGISLDLGE